MRPRYTPPMDTRYRPRGQRAYARGTVTAEVFRGGRCIARRTVRNLITDVGDTYLAALMHTVPAAPAGMKLGTSDAAPAKSGAGSYIGAATYVSGSAKAIDGGFPAAGPFANSARFRTSYAAGEGTADGIKEAALVGNTSNAGEADGSDTFARAVFSSGINKAAGDTLVVTWDITITGA